MHPIPELAPDLDRIDRLMEAHGLDVLVVTSKHNVQYMLAGYRFIFFSGMDAVGHSRYLPVVIYRRGRADQTAYVGNHMEKAEHAVHPFWVPNLLLRAWGSVDAAEAVVEHLGAIGADGSRIGYEPGFLPSDAGRVMAQLPLVDATTMLEEMRGIKTGAELAFLRRASELITESMVATIAAADEGWTKARIIEELRQQEVKRGLAFDYCLLTLGASHNRVASDQVWQRGEVLSIDSGGSYRGFIGDLCRMGVLGEPDPELVDLLAEVESVQQAAFSRIAPGVLGGELVAAAEVARLAGPSAAFNDFFAHGMGLISHEVPFLMTNHPVAYEGTYALKPLEVGMVLSVETTMLHPRRGFLKLEDTVVVTEGGYEMYGTTGRGWNRGGVA
ncbi:MAG: M24 family metallopeptidase [Paracoccaceae bacterium]